eukprot:1159176-Prymnesium_polylepis.1
MQLPSRSLFDACVDAPLRTGWVSRPTAPGAQLGPAYRRGPLRFAVATQGASTTCSCNNSLTILNCMGTAPTLGAVSAALTSTSTMTDYAPWPAANKPYRSVVQEGCQQSTRTNEGVRQYLRTVYPAAHFGDRGRVRDKQMLRFFRSLHWYYAAELSGSMSLLNKAALADAAPRPAAPQALVARPAFECYGGRMHSKLVQKYTATPAHFGFLPCAPGADCVARQARFESEYSSHRFFEVWHFALKSKREPSNLASLRWNQVLDGERWVCPALHEPLTVLLSRATAKGVSGLGCAAAC